jgi:tRNA A37 methylthiotransferase MiaB
MQLGISKPLCLAVACCANLLFLRPTFHRWCQAIVEAAGLNADGKRRQVVVTGCLAQRYGPALASDLPEADLVLGFQAYGGLPAELAQRLGMPSSSSSDASSSSRVQVRALYAA